MSNREVMDAGASRPAQPISDGGGVVTTVELARNPYESLDDLMVVVELLCKEWPPRDSSLPGATLLL